MEPQRRELLAQCQQSLAQAMTEVEAVLGLLEAAGALSPGERRQLDEEAGGAKAELLLQLLLAKEQDHFQDLRAALEKTQPHLLPILYLNGVVGPPQSTEGAGEWQSRAAPPALRPPLLSAAHQGAWGAEALWSRPALYLYGAGDTFLVYRGRDGCLEPNSHLLPLSFGFLGTITLHRKPRFSSPCCYCCRVLRRPPGSVAGRRSEDTSEGCRSAPFLSFSRSASPSGARGCNQQEGNIGQGKIPCFHP